MNKKEYFISSLLLESHPMRNVKYKIRKEYYDVLSYIIEQTAKPFGVSDIVKCRLEQYQSFLVKNALKNTRESIESIVDSMIGCSSQSRRKKYRYWMMCDIALILLEDAAIQKAAGIMKTYIKKRQRQQFERFLLTFKGQKTDGASNLLAGSLISQYYENRNFLKKREQRFIVTANMSAGKSTLINALAGKNLARASQEACTGNLCYLYHKAFEDGNVHLETTQLETAQLSINVKQEDLTAFASNSIIKIASYFRGIERIDQRFCIIDTPGVNFSMNKDHGKITRKALADKAYDRVIYVLNANKLGTDEEIAYLKWISENVSKDKVTFVLNKLDSFHSADDDVFSSIEGARRDLTALGYENPMICPISAYFAFLIKKKHFGDSMTEDEMDEYKLYTKKFSRPVYDLSKYYEGAEGDASDSEELSMSKKSGLYGLEKILFGGAL